MFQQRRGVRMHEAAGVGTPQILAALIVFPRGGVGKLLFLVYAAGGDPITEHFGHILFRHFTSADINAAVLAQAIIDPIFEVVAIPPLVMQPRQADAVGDTLGVIGTAITLIVFHAAPEFRGTVLAQVVCQSLPHQSQLPAIVPYPTAVRIYGVQVIEQVHGAASFPMMQPV